MNLIHRSVLGFGGLTAAAAFSACGSNTGLGGKESSDGGPTPIQWYHQYGEEGVKETVKRYAAEYTAAKVDVKWNPGDYGSVLATQLLINDVSDVLEVEQSGSLDMIRFGQLGDLTETIASVCDDFNEAVIKRSTFDGKIHGTPQTTDMQLLYYRPSLLQVAGVTAPATFDDPVKAVNAVATSDMGGLFAGNKSGVDVLGLLLIWAPDHDQLDADHAVVAFLTNNFYAAPSAYRDSYQFDRLLKAASVDWLPDATFVNGETAMQQGGLWSLSEIIAAHGDDAGVLPLPATGARG